MTEFEDPVIRAAKPSATSDAAPLRAVLPFDSIKSHFSNKISRIHMGLDDLDTICRLCPSDMFLLACNCAIRAKNLYRPEIDMMPLVPFIEQRNPSVIKPLGVVLGQEAIEDIYCCRCSVEDKSLQDTLVASLLVAQVYPRDLYIGMVTFADPSAPISPDHRKSVLQKYKGLGLLREFLGRVEACAVARGCCNITLVANELSQTQLFERHGFRIDSYPAAENARLAGRLIPMHKAVS